eukprot:CAMPEP_0202864216 /NCGR_PEP_ID=MMETSP1391-20130828/4548_1 /ASSEMBLY_ACC=CAM_ASM_000867 /TAXON_ID=1034604 /ORGANISM="Chlamydomonas leiostraca, Strain SAG 11-49" /LENGTH=187 /DNA_ID=CAMNT_0049543939 /DNA_START=78 /DNA_END=638 /DNA_ORIENTATION=-
MLVQRQSLFRKDLASSRSRHNLAVTASNKKPRGKKPQPKQQSAIGAFIAKTPILNRFQDGTLILGDLVMVAATEFSSERLTDPGAVPILCGTMMASWLVASAAMGDYKGGVPSSDNWYLQVLGPSFISVVDGMLTWALAAAISLVAYSVMVSTGTIEEAWILGDLATENLSPQLEIIVAMLITMSCW